jgi:hypothetical protein
VARPCANRWIPSTVLLVSLLAWALAHAAPSDRPSRIGVVVGADQTVEEVIAFGVSVEVAGTVTETVIVIGGDVRLAETARIGDDIFVVGGTLEQDPGAQVAGAVTVVSPSLVQALATAGGHGGAVLGVLLLARTILCLVVGATAWQLAPTDLSARQGERLIARPVRVIGLGLLWATLLGTAALVASLTLIGLPLGLLLLVFLGGEGVLGLAVALAYIRHPARFPMRGRRVLVMAMVVLGLLPLVGEGILYATATIGLGVTLDALAEARGARRALLRAGR